jgi:hypothetical protein
VRSAAQIGRTVSEWHEHQAAERRHHLAAFLSMCRAARERGDEWVRWLDAGRPAYTEAEYAAIAKERRKEGDRG